MKHTLTTLAASLASISTAASLHAQTRVVYVDQSAPPGGNGSSWASAFRDLNEAIAFSLQGRHPQADIRIAQGLYRPQTINPDRPIAFDLGFTGSAVYLSLTGSFAGLRGPDPDARDFANTPTILSGDVLGNDAPDGSGREDNAQCVLLMSAYSDIQHGSVAINGLTIEGAAHRDGFSPYATLLSADEDVSVSHCEFRDNQNVGLMCGTSYTAVTSSAFRRNVGLQGGGLYVGSSQAYINDSVFEANSAERGGGMYLDNVRFAQCTGLRIVANTATSEGGGIFGADHCSLDDSLIASNSATVGGGLFGLRSAINCTIVENSASWGGGIHAFGGTLTNSILSSNHARTAGAQISISQSVVQVTSSIVEGGVASIFRAFNATVDATQVFDHPPEFINPLGRDGDAATWQDNDYHLQPHSFAINRGTNTNLNGLDLDHNPRVQPRYPGGPDIPDLGCYEYQPHCPADINQDNGITVDDLLAFLSAYTLGQPLADIDDGSGTNTPDDAVTIEDLLYFLSRYNQGC